MPVSAAHLDPIMSDSSCTTSIEKAWSRRFYRWKGYATSLTGSVTDAEEVIQEAIARTLRANPPLSTEKDAHHYVLAAVRSVALQLFRHRGRQRAVEPRELERHDEAASNPLRMLLRAEAESRNLAMAQKAFNALQAMEPHLREVVQLLVLEEPPMKLREVAEIQGAPISTVHSRLQSALRQLAREIGDRE